MEASPGAPIIREEDNIDLWVSGGSFDAPHYQFYTNAAGTEELKGLSLDTDYTYTFRRLGGSTSHPFYLSDTGFKEASTDAITIHGHGNPSSGITGDQSFTISFNDSADEIGDLLYYCSSHSSMQGEIQLMEASPGAKTQTVYTAQDTISYAPGASFRLPLLYDTGNNDPNLSGLTLNVHYDSSVLTPIGDDVPEVAAIPCFYPL